MRVAVVTPWAEGSKVVITVDAEVSMAIAAITTAGVTPSVTSRKTHEGERGNPRGRAPAPAGEGKDEARRKNRRRPAKANTPPAYRCSPLTRRVACPTWGMASITNRSRSRCRWPPPRITPCIPRYSANPCLTMEVALRATTTNATPIRRPTTTTTTTTAMATIHPHRNGGATGVPLEGTDRKNRKSHAPTPSSNPRTLASPTCNDSCANSGPVPKTRALLPRELTPSAISARSNSSAAPPTRPSSKSSNANGRPRRGTPTTSNRR
mmetsp:Transcript_19246/g.34772  ORF Transcript_19246/g.34772 Transcript_19246/m.34772 type:complete len:266 (+) Transcript_19246:715-1512(+)